MFEVINKTVTANINNLVNTMHNSNERNERTANIINVLGGYGKPMYSFIVDTNHPNGYEIHTITDNGIIVIQNYNSEKLITCLIARGNQIRRYFNGCIPIEIYSVINKANEHQAKGYNYW